MNFASSQSTGDSKFSGISEETSAVMRVLLVDDDEDEFIVVRSLLQRSAATPEAARFSVDWMGDAEMALKEIAKCAHDAYLIDYRLGDLTGLQLIERAVAAGCDAPLILLCGQDDPRVDAEAVRIGATDYLVKDQLSGALLERTLRYAIAGKQNERELRAFAAQNARLMAAIESASVGVSLTETRGEENVITYVNSAFERMTGYAAAEIIGQTLSVLGGPQTAPELVKQVRQKMLNGEMCQGTAVNIRRDGTRFWNEAHFAPIPTAPGESSGHVGFFQDVTARVEAESAVAQARRNLEIAQQIAHLGSWSYELPTPGEWESALGFWSDETFRILGLEPRSLVPAREVWFERVHPEDLEAARQILSKAMEGEQEYAINCRVVHPDGQERIVQTRAQIERDARGHVVRMNGTILDVTERERAQQAERALEYRLHAVMQTAPIILWTLDNDGVVTLSEGHTLRRLGFEPGEAVGQSVFELYRDNAQALNMCQRALRGEEVEEISNEQGRTFAIYVGPIWNERHEQTGVVGISHDITEQFRAQQALRESEARFERLMLNVPGMVYQLMQTPDGAYQFLYVSEASHHIYGVSPAQALQNAELLLDAVFDEEKAEFRAGVAHSARDLTDCQMEFSIVRPDGERRFIRSQSRPVKREDGSIVWDGVVVDLTQTRVADEALRQSRRALDEAQRLAHIGSFTRNLRTGASAWSDETYRMFEMELGSPVPAPEEILMRYHPDDRAAIKNSIETRSQQGRDVRMLVRLLRRDGSIRHIESRSSLQNDSAGEPMILHGSLQDVTERVEAERALRESEERYALAARGTNDGLWDWNLVSDEIYFSPHWKAMSGYSEEEISNSPTDWLKRVHLEDLPILQTHMEAHLSGHSAQCECEYRLLNAVGEYRWMLMRGLALFDADGVATRLSGSQTDITERKLAESLLEHNAFYDTALTNLPNRALFAERLDRTIARGNRHPQHTFAVLFLDIDHFKKINDSLGHLVGDRLLIEASARFQNCLRPEDTVARFGGDEFAILLEDIGGIEDVHQVAERIHAELEVPFQLDGHEAFVTVSMGIVMGQGESANAEELLRSADTAMYRAKGAGRGRHEIFEATMHTRAVKMLEMETDLWRALERDELRLHYQPIVDLSNGAIRGFEALVRWQHPQRGLVSPGDFIPLAEETGLIVPMGWWVLEEACRQAIQWQDKFGPLWMSVNFSPKQLSQRDMSERVRGSLERTGFDPSLLRLEVTETVIMESAQSAVEMFLSLKELGVSFAIDDFGTGYSSLSYLHRFPLDAIKIDRSFISQMQPGARDHEIVNTIISMARGLKMNVVAEGVETEQQLQALREMRCGYAQGFYISKPQESAQIEALLGRNLSW